MTPLQAAQQARNLVDEIAVRPLVQEWCAEKRIVCSSAVSQITEAVCAAECSLVDKVSFVVESMKGGFVDTSVLNKMMSGDDKFDFRVVLKNSFLIDHSESLRLLGEAKGDRARGAAVGSYELFFLLGCHGAAWTDLGDLFIPDVGYTEVKAVRDDSCFFAASGGTATSSMRHEAGALLARIGRSGVKSLAHKHVMALTPVERGHIASILTGSMAFKGIEDEDIGREFYVPIATYGFSRLQDTTKFDALLAIDSTRGLGFGIFDKEQFTSALTRGILRMEPAMLNFTSERGRGIGLRFA